MSDPSNAVPSTDPAVYEEYATKWAALPRDEAGWIQRAKDVAAVLEQDAAGREGENKSPRAEVQLLKHSGLLKILGWAKYGGGEQPWSVAYRAIREVAKADGSIGMLLGYHLLWSTTANVIGTAEQTERIQELVISNNYFIGGAVNPRDADLKISIQGDQLVFNRTKHFNTGGVVLDLTVLEGVLEGVETHIFVFVPTKQPGITFKHNWENVGLRLTESGGVTIQDVKAEWSDALGWDPKTKTPDPSVLAVPFASLLLPGIQLVFANFSLGIALGALNFGSRYTTTNTRAWPYGGDDKEQATEEIYVLSTYGNLLAHLWAAEVLMDKAGGEVDGIYARYSTQRGAFKARERGELGEWVASAKVATTDTLLRVTSGIFEVTGSRSTATRVGLDRYWKDVQMHTLHDPVSYNKNRELGRYQLLNEIPGPTLYT